MATTLVNRGRHSADRLSCRPGIQGVVSGKGEVVTPACGDGHHLAQIRQATDLASIVVCQVQCRTVAFQEQTVAPRRTQVDDVFQVRGSGRAIAVCASPRDQRAVASNSDAAKRPSCDRHYIAQATRHVRLAVIVVATGDHGAVGFEREAVARFGVSTRRNGYDVAQARRHAGLAVVVAAPGDNRAVALERERVIRPGGDGDHVGHAGGHQRLPIVRILALAGLARAPGRNGTVAFSARL